MSESNSSYRQIIKAISIFGGVQVLNILSHIIKSKIVAVLLGPTGIGIIGLLTSATGLVSNFTNFGLGTSAVRDVATANKTENLDRISIIVTVLRRWVWVTGLLGLVLMIVFSKWISILTFGTTKYTVAFAWISLSLLFNQLSSGQMVVLQGMQKLRYLAKAAIFGNILGLFFSIPLYYWLGFDAIVPVIVISSLTMLLCTWIYARRVSVPIIKVSRQRTIAEGRSMLKMGFMISLSSLITIGGSYIVRIFINYHGTIDQVGLYTAGFAIVTNYVGVVFTAMGTDYFPRLAGVSHNNNLCRDAINQQAEIGLLILAPILIGFLVFSNFLVVLLYSSDFLPIKDMILYIALGMFFRVASWSIGFVFLAKGASSMFFWNELLTNTYLLSFNLIGYYLGGLSGLGISFLISYFFHVLQMYFFARKYYSFSFSGSLYRIFFYQFAIAISCFLVVKHTSIITSYSLGSLLVLVSITYSFFELDKKIGLKKIITNSLK